MPAAVICSTSSAAAMRAAGLDDHATPERSGSRAGTVPLVVLWPLDFSPDLTVATLAAVLAARAHRAG